jgi:hypothetical protein
MTRPLILTILMAAPPAGRESRSHAVPSAACVIPESEVILALRVAAIDGATPDLSGAQNAKRPTAWSINSVLHDGAATHARLCRHPPERTGARSHPALYASESEYRAALERAGVTEPQLKAHLLAGLQMLRYTDLRFRGEVQITEENLREFFNTFAAEAKQNNSAEVPDFESNRDQVEKLFTDQRTTQALDRWLGITRNETQILYRDAAFK